MIRPIALVVTLLLASPALAQFEGRAEYAFRSPRAGDGSVTVLLSKDGARTELTLPSNGQRIVTLTRAREPGRTWFLHEGRRTYTVVDAPKDDAERTRYQVARGGREQIAGHPCDDAIVTGEGTGRMEVCVTKDFGAVPMIGAFQGEAGKGNPFAALARAGLTGLPVQWKTFDGAGNLESTFQLRSAAREKVPADKLRVPAGYAQGSAYDTLASPQQQEEMKHRMDQVRQQLEQLPPAERQALEQRMRERGVTP